MCRTSRHREVAGEHAAVDTEGLDGVLEPGREDGGTHRPERHRETRQLAHYVVSQAGERVDASPPERALLLRIRARPSGVLDDNDQIIETGELGRRDLKLTGWVISSNRRSRSCKAWSTSASGSGVSRAHWADPTDREALICRSTSSTASATVPVGGSRRRWRRDRRWHGVRIELDGFLDRVTNGRGGDIDELPDCST